MTYPNFIKLLRFLAGFVAIFYPLATIWFFGLFLMDNSYDETVLYLVTSIKYLVYSILSYLFLYYSGEKSKNTPTILIVLVFAAVSVWFLGSFVFQLMTAGLFGAVSGFILFELLWALILYYLVAFNLRYLKSIALFYGENAYLSKYEAINTLDRLSLRQLQELSIYITTNDRVT